VVQDLAQIKQLVSTPLPKQDPVGHREQVNKLASWLGWIAEKISVLEFELAKLKEEKLLPKSKDYTELDRNIQLDADVAEAYKRVNLLKRYEKAIYTIISIGQTEQRSMSEEMKRRLDDSAT